MSDAAPAVPVAPAAPAAPASQWYDGFTDPAVKGHAATKQWATAEDAVRSGIHLEKLIGIPQDQILKLPKADAAATDWDPVYDRLGRPKTADEYKLDGPNAEYNTLTAKIMHENGLSLKQAQAVSKGFEANVQSAIAAATETDRLEAVADQAALTREWGAAYEKNVQVARAAAHTFGIDGDTIDALQDVMGLKATMQFLQNLGSKIGEDSFVAASGGGAFNGAMTPAQAQGRIDALKGDKEFVKKFLAGDSGAKKEMHELHQMAYQD